KEGVRGGTLGSPTQGDAFAGAGGGGGRGGGRVRLEPLLTAEETRRAEEAHPGSMEELMERAGTAVAEVVLGRFSGSVAVVCGKGNNGGDGRVCARVLREAGRDVTVVDGFGELGEPDVIVDALFGIGLRDAPREDAGRMIERINAARRPVVAIDVPSGVDGSTGEIPGAAVRASVTVTFGAPKVGLAVAPGKFHAGSVHVAQIGLRLPERPEHALVPATALADVPRKEPSSSKYRAGSVLVVGGSRGLTVLTPQAGELARLLDIDARDVEAHRLDAVRRAASRFGCVVLLKGADTLVAAPREGVLVAGYGEPSLATAGTGDVLTGVAAAFLAKEMKPQLAAAAGAVAHGIASRLVQPSVGLVASDLLPGIQRALAGEGWEPPLQ